MKYTKSVDGQMRANIITKMRFSKEALAAFKGDIEIVHGTGKTVHEILSSMLYDGLFALQCQADDMRNDKSNQ